MSELFRAFLGGLLDKSGELSWLSALIAEDGADQGSSKTWP
jgi:hypothetical protein